MEEYKNPNSNDETPWRKKVTRIFGGGKNPKDEISKVLQENEKKAKVANLENNIRGLEQYIKDSIISPHTHNFAPERDMLQLQSLRAEYQKLIEKESNFYDANSSWIIDLLQKIIILLGMLNLKSSLEELMDEESGIKPGFLDKLLALSDSLDENDDNNKNIIKKVLTQYTDLTPKQFVGKQIEDYKIAIAEIKAKLEELKGIRHPDQVVEEFEALLSSVDREEGSLSYTENAFTKILPEQIQQYKERYIGVEKQINEYATYLHNTWKDAVTWIIETGTEDLGVIKTQIETTISKQADLLYRHKELNNLEDTTLELLAETAKTYQIQGEKNAAFIENKINQYSELRTQIDVGEIAEEDIYAGWDKMQKEFITLRERSEASTGTIKVFGEQILQEQHRRTLDKLRTTYRTMIEKICNEYATIVDMLLKKEKNAIDKERKKLGALLMSTDENLEDIEKKLANLKNSHTALEKKDNPEFKNKCLLIIKAKYALDSMEYTLIEQGVLDIQPELHNACIEKLVKGGKQALLGELLSSSHLPDLAPGPEMSRIIEYRNVFKKKIDVTTIDYPGGIDAVIAKAESMIANGSFRLSVCGGLTTGEYFLGGKRYGIVDAGSVLEQKEEGVVKFDYNRLPLRGVAYELRRNVVTKDTSKRPQGIGEKIQPAIDRGAEVMHHTGNNKTNNDFHETRTALKSAEHLSDDAAFLVMMYLQGLYGRYWIGGNRGCVNLYDNYRGFVSYAHDSSSASLLLSANRLLSATAGLDGGETPLGETELARIARYRHDRLTEIKNTNKKPEKLKQIADEMIHNGEFTLTQKAGITGGRFEIGGFKKCFGTSDRHWKDKLTDTNDTLSEYAYNNTTLSGGSRYELKLQALRSNIISERAEPIGTQMKEREKQGISFDHAGGFKQLIDIIMKKKFVSEADALAIYMYLTGQYGYYWTGQYVDHRRGYVDLRDFNRGFGSLGDDGSGASLLLSR